MLRAGPLPHQPAATGQGLGALGSRKALRPPDRAPVVGLPSSRAPPGAAWRLQFRRSTGAGAPPRSVVGASTPGSVAAAVAAAHEKDKKRHPGRTVLMNAVMWIIFYFWLFKSAEFVDAVVSRSPVLESAAYIILGSIPIIMIRANLFDREVTAPLGFLAARTKAVGVRHFLESLREPLHWAAKVILIYISANLYAQAFTGNFQIPLPKHLWFIDPNGDGILTAPEIEMTMARSSLRFLHAALGTCVGLFFLTVKKPPQEFHPSTLDRIKGFLQAYWARVLLRRGVPVVLDLALTFAAISFMILQWFRFLGLDARTVLTFGGISGIAFGLAAQNLVGNFISGILILVTQPFRAGDWIEAAGVQGTVKAITWSYTEVETEDGPTVFIPNSSISDEQTSNRTQGKVRNVEVKVPLLFPAGGFKDCRELLESLAAHVAAVPALKERLVDEPEVNFNILGGELATGEVIVSCTLDNAGLGASDKFRSELSIAVVDYILSRGCQVPVLEAPKTVLEG